MCQIHQATCRFHQNKMGKKGVPGGEGACFANRLVDNLLMRRQCAWLSSALRKIPTDQELSGAEINSEIKIKGGADFKMHV